MQKQKHEILNEQIKATDLALAKVIAKYGEGSVYALEYQNKLLDLKIAQAELADEMDKTTESIKEQIDYGKKLIEVAEGYTTIQYAGGTVKYKTGGKGSTTRGFSSKEAEERYDKKMRELGAPSWLFHDGGWVGRPWSKKFDEIMATLQTGEFVLSRKMIDRITSMVESLDIITMPKPIQTAEAKQAKSGDIHQHITINSPTPLTPSEIAGRIFR